MVKKIISFKLHFGTNGFGKISFLLEGGGPELVTPSLDGSSFSAISLILTSGNSYYHTGSRVFGVSKDSAEFDTITSVNFKSSVNSLKKIKFDKKIISTL